MDLKIRGAYVYAKHPSTDALLASYKFSDESHVKRWRRGQPCPQEVVDHISCGGMIHAFNAAFERLIWWFVMTPRHGWPRPALEQFSCTAVAAAAMSLPRDLDSLGAALDLKTKKDKLGSSLMKIHSIPIGFTPSGDAIWHPKADDPESLERYHEYCDFDVLSEAEAESRLIPLSTSEMEVYWLNERLNDRGQRIYVVSARAALEIAEKAKSAINAELAEVTDHQVTKLTQTAKMKEWLVEQGVEMPSLDKDDVDEFLHDYDDLPAKARRVLELRQEGAKPSVDKIAGMLKRVDEDDHVRGVYLHMGAGQTHRFSSRGLQAHNMPRYRKVFEDAHIRQAELFEAIRTGEPDMLTFMYGPELGRPLHLLSDAVRGFIMAAPGHEFIVADYGSIEGRFAAWIADEHWKVRAFEAFDRGEGPGMYELTASHIYNVLIELVDKMMRSGGKVAELSMQFEGSVGALAKMARQNKIKLPKLFDKLWEAAPVDRRDKAQERYEERLSKHDKHAEKMGREGWLVAELIKVGWRSKHPAIKAAWKDLNSAARAAVTAPGVRVEALNGRVSYLVARGCLWCQLPSGSVLCYGRPAIREIDAPWADMTLEPALREKISAVLVLGVDAASGKWVRYPVYGGSLFNNVVQGSCRDILVSGLKHAEKDGWRLVGHVHDELICEMPIGARTVKELEEVICQVPDWCAGMPLVADGWAGKRYRKA